MKLIISGLIVVQLGILGWFWRFLPAQVPLFFSRPWGEEQLAAPVYLTFLPGLAFAALLLVFLVSYFVGETSKFVVKIMETAALLLTIFNLITLAQIIRLVT